LSARLRTSAHTNTLTTVDRMNDTELSWSQIVFL